MWKSTWFFNAWILEYFLQGFPNFKKVLWSFIVFLIISHNFGFPDWDLTEYWHRSIWIILYFCFYGVDSILFTQYRALAIIGKLYYSLNNFGLSVTMSLENSLLLEHELTLHKAPWSTLFTPKTLFYV